MDCDEHLLAMAADSGHSGDAGIVPDTVALGPGETTWVTAVVQPLVACPGPAPLQFQVTYSVNCQKDTFTCLASPI
jgi:hypothetical protein